MAYALLVKVGFSPLDEELELLPGRLTPRLQEGLVRLSTWIPSFAKAANEFAWFTQVKVDRSTAARITESAGAAAVAVYEREVERIERECPEAPAGPDTLIFSVDGAMVPLQHREWAEVRTLAVGAVAPAVEHEGESVIKTHDLSYFSRLANSETFSQQALGELHRRGMETARRVGAVVDGAVWCQSCIDLHYPEAVRILDFAHAAEYLNAIGRPKGVATALLSEAEITRLRHDLKHTGPTTVLAELRVLVAAHPNVPDLPSSLAYLEKREAHMQYPQFVAQGWPIGSGCVESANKLVVEDRLKGAGMHWAASHVNPMLALRNAVCNDRWVEAWGQIEIHQRQRSLTRRSQQQQERLQRRSPPHLLTDLPPVQPAPVPTPSPTSAPAPASANSSAPHRPSAHHPWRQTWSVRRQRQLANTP
jgi:hypothetical protein